jgi:hypothetical protein
MKSMVDILCWVVGVGAIGVAFWQFMLFVGAKDPKTGLTDMTFGMTHLWYAIAAAVLACACIVYYFIRHPRVEEEIHVTR